MKMTNEQNIDFLKKRGFVEQWIDHDGCNAILVKRIPLGGDAQVDVKVMFGTCYGISCDLWLIDYQSGCRVWIGADTGVSFAIPADGDVKELLKAATEQIKAFGKFLNTAAKMVSRKSVSG